MRFTNISYPRGFEKRLPLRIFAAQGLKPEWNAIRRPGKTRSPREPATSVPPASAHNYPLNAPHRTAREKAMSGDHPKPDYAKNMRFVGWCDQGGRSDGVQIMVHRGYAYIGHIFSKGF